MEAKENRWHAEWSPSPYVVQTGEQNRPTSRAELKSVEEAIEVEIDIKLARTDLWRLIAEDYSRRQDFFTMEA